MTSLGCRQMPRHLKQPAPAKLVGSLTRFALKELCSDRDTASSLHQIGKLKRGKVSYVLELSRALDPDGA